ncbi:MAG: TIGR03013 family XrtA/PEP-CTERM system glycosyltransferase [Nitrospira sp.]
MQPTVSTSPCAPNIGARRFTIKKRVLILGADALARDLCQALMTKRIGRFEIVGLLDKSEQRIGERIADSRVIGTFDQLHQMIEQHQAHIVAVCIEDRRAQLPIQTLLDIKVMGLEVVDGHQLYETESGRLSIDLLRPSALIFSTGFKRRKAAMGLKRLIDLMGASFGLILTLPLFVVVGGLIKLDSRGPVFYRQVRVGLRGQPYMIWKFRSMKQDAEMSGPRWAQEGDPRISRVGKWLRKLRIDELPQFINVLKGEMSLVGPRPERPVFVQELREQIPYYDIRHTVRPGITGWAQTQFRYGASAEDSHMKLQFDLYYVKNLSAALDMRVLLETIRVVLFGEGAR